MKIAGVNLSGVPLLPVLGTVLAGQLFASQFTGYTLYGAALCAALCFAGICVRRYMVSLAGAFCGIGMLAVWISEPAENGFTGHEVTLNGVVIEATPRAESQRLIIDLNACEGFDERIRTLVYYRNSEPPVEAGDIVRVTGVMTEPFDKPVVEGEFSMEGFTRRRVFSGRTGSCVGVKRHPCGSDGLFCVADILSVSSGRQTKMGYGRCDCVLVVLRFADRSGAVGGKGCDNGDCGDGGSYA